MFRQICLYYTESTVNESVLVPISTTILHTKLKESLMTSNTFTTKFCTYQDSSAVLVCAEICCDWSNMGEVIYKYILSKFELLSWFCHFVGGMSSWLASRLAVKHHSMNRNYHDDTDKKFTKHPATNTKTYRHNLMTSHFPSKVRQETFWCSAIWTCKQVVYTNK